MSTTFPNNLVYLDFARRQTTIRLIIARNRLGKPQLESLIEMHNFLSEVEAKIREGSMDKETLNKIKKEVEYIYEKFDQMFEMIKNELII